METLNQDVRYAFRNLRKAPSFAVVSVLTLALGIGASTAIFSILENILMEPFPYPDVQRYMSLQIHDTDRSQTERSRLDYPVSALDVATMGALSRLPWWRRPGRARARGRARGARAGSASATLAERDLRRALRRPAPARPDRPRPGPGRPRAAARRALLRPRPARRRAPRSADRRRWPARAARVVDRHPRPRAGAALGLRALPQPPPDRRRPARSRRSTAPCSKRPTAARSSSCPAAAAAAILPPHHHHH